MSGYNPQADYEKFIKNRPRQDIVVQRGNGPDFIDVFNAYAGERVIKIPFDRHNNYEIEDGVICPAGHVVLEGEHMFGATIEASATMTAMIDSVRLKTDSLHIKNLHFKCGVSGTLRADHAIRARSMHSAQAVPDWKCNILLENLRVTYANGYGIHLDNPVANAEESSGWVRNTTIREGKGGLYCDMSDVWMDELYIGNMSDVAGDDYLAGIYVKRGGCQINHPYIFSGFKHGIVINKPWVQVNHGVIDNLQHHGIFMRSADYCTVEASISQCSQKTDNTYSCVYIDGGSENNLFKLKLGKRTGSNEAKYGIEEKTGADTNEYHVFFEAAVWGTDKYVLGGTGSVIKIARDDKYPIFVPYNGKILDINESDTSDHTADVATPLSETRDILALIVKSPRISGTGHLEWYPNEGADTFQASSSYDCHTVALAAGLNRVKYKQSVANDDFDVYCMGYWCEDINR